LWTFSDFGTSFVTATRSALNETKTVALAKRWQKEGDAVKEALRRFSEQLAV
jgi:hypothetical protein